MKSPPARSHIRGSSLLFAGRGLAVLINLVSQVLVVRSLTKGDFGSFSFALSIVAIGTNLNLFGMHRALPRFVPLYEERGDPARSMGAVLAGVALVLAFGLFLVALVIGAEGLWRGSLVGDPRAASLLLVVALLLPIQALDSLMQSLAAVFLGARAIFFRRHILGPVARLVAVLAVMAIGGDAVALAWGYVLAGLVGVVVYGPMLMRALRARGYLELLRPGRVKFPTRAILAFSGPILILDLALVLKGQLAIILLESLRGSIDVASYRAVVSPAGLVLIGIQSFKPLFMPAATRLFARADWNGIAGLYWSTTRWLLVLSFPMLAVCLAMPEALSTGLFGARYADSAAVLAVLAAGNYLSLSLGLGSYTLHVHGRLAVQTIGSAVALAVGIALFVVLIPRYGPLGAALGTAGMLAVQTLWDTTALLRLTPMGGIPANVKRLLVMILGVSIVLYGLGRTDVHFLVGGTAAVLAAVAVLLFARDDLDVEDTFPELGRVPFIRRLVGRRGTA